MGFLYRIFLSRTLGAEGLGIYQISLSVLGLFMTITSSGIPVTVSRMMIKHVQSGDEQKASKTISAGILIAIATSIPLTLLVFSKSGLLNVFFSDNRCLPILAIMIPGLIFTSVYAVIRGTFWGNRQFLTYSVIEFLEEAVMLLAGIILVNCAVDFSKGVEMAGYAVLISYLFSFTLSGIVFFAKKGKLSPPFGQISPLVKSSAPITAMRTSTSLMNTLVAIILPARLISSGLATSDATALFGKVFGMAFPLIFMPSSLIGSLALVLNPELSSNYYSKNYLTLKNNVEKSLKFSCIIACTIIPVFLCASEQICQFIYSDATVGSYVLKGALTMLPLSVSIITTSTLNSLNKEKQTLLSFFVGASAMIISIYFLPQFIGVNALIVGNFLNFSITSIINVALLYKYLPVKMQIVSHFIKCTLAIIPSAIFGLLIKGLVLNKLGYLPTAIICSVLVLAFITITFFALNLYDFVFEKQREDKKLLNFKGFKKRHSLDNGH